MDIDECNHRLSAIQELLVSGWEDYQVFLKEYKEFMEGAREVKRLYTLVKHAYECLKFDFHAVKLGLREPLEELIVLKNEMRYQYKESIKLKKMIKTATYDVRKLEGSLDALNQRYKIKCFGRVSSAEMLRDEMALKLPSVLNPFRNTPFIIPYSHTKKETIEECMAMLEQYEQVYNSMERYIDSQKSQMNRDVEHFMKLKDDYKYIHEKYAAEESLYDRYLRQHNLDNTRVKCISFANAVNKLHEDNEAYRRTLNKLQLRYIKLNSIYYFLKNKCHPPKHARPTNYTDPEPKTHERRVRFSDNVEVRYF